MTPRQYGAFLNEERQKWRAAVRACGGAAD